MEKIPGRKIGLAIIETNIEFTFDKNTNCYFAFLDKNGILIPIQCDTGASRTSISLLSFIGANYDYSESDAERIEEELLILKNKGKHSQIEGSNLAIEFHSASGDNLFGFLTDMGKVFIGNTELQHFYYYFVPKNKTAFALLGNDFLHNCEYKHDIGGNIVITKFDESGYEYGHKDALSLNEIKELIINIDKIVM